MNIPINTRLINRDFFLGGRIQGIRFLLVFTDYAFIILDDKDVNMFFF